ncbi:hypothetical protein CL621_03855 [archaeon]|nr:hypothetical protein [archaeon]|tara:strand:- start:5272 stop:6036 length:765 start_codon:yes stop_codon:yes gene_type:complete
MLTKKENIEDVKKIMGIEVEMLKILPKLSEKMDSFNPWVKQIPSIFQELDLKENQTILDIPCGKGGVSVSLAKKYNVKVIGYDIIKEYVESANKLAKKNDVNNLCTFKAGDIRDITKKKNICNLLLWIAPPHIWKTSKNTIKSLRNCIKSNGLILIADAYLYKKNKKYEDYETLESTNKGYTFYGDKIIKFIDYKDKLWKKDYDRTKKSVQETLNKTKKDKKLIEKYLESLDKDEKSDTKYLGLAIWIIQINKK